MNRRHIWTIAALGLLVTSLAWFAHAQTQPVLPTLEASSRGHARSSGSADTYQSTQPMPPSGMPGASRSSTRTFRRQAPEQKLEQQTREFVEKYRRSGDTGGREGLRGDLQKVVSEHFDLRQTARERELAELEKELERLRSLHQRRQNQKDRIVGDRVESLLREADGLGWGSARSNPAVPRYSPPLVPPLPATARFKYIPPASGGPVR
jgi:hypothetical protein